MLVVGGSNPSTPTIFQGSMSKQDSLRQSLLALYEQGGGNLSSFIDSVIVMLEVRDEEIADYHVMLLDLARESRISQRAESLSKATLG